jgi:hypothetical protein
MDATVCARCGRAVDLRDHTVAKLPRSMVPAGVEMAHDDGLGLAALFCREWRTWSCTNPSAGPR